MLAGGQQPQHTLAACHRRCPSLPCWVANPLPPTGCCACRAGSQGLAQHQAALPCPAWWPPPCPQGPAPPEPPRPGSSCRPQDAIHLPHMLHTRAVACNAGCGGGERLMPAMLQLLRGSISGATATWPQGSCTS